VSSTHRQPKAELSLAGPRVSVRGQMIERREPGILPGFVFSTILE
jgi:hypothetical protein